MTTEPIFLEAQLSPIRICPHNLTKGVLPGEQRGATMNHMPVQWTPESPSPWISVLIFAGIAIGIGALFWYFGQAGRNTLSGWLLVISFGPSGSEIRVLDARLPIGPYYSRKLVINGVVLVKETGNSNWRLISLDDYSAAAPVLASDGKAVAYRSMQDGAQVVVVFFWILRSGSISRVATSPLLAPVLISVRGHRLPGHLKMRDWHSMCATH